MKKGFLFFQNQNIKQVEKATTTCWHNKKTSIFIFWKLFFFVHFFVRSLKKKKKIFHGLCVYKISHVTILFRQIQFSIFFRLSHLTLFSGPFCSPIVLKVLVYIDENCCVVNNSCNVCVCRCVMTCRYKTCEISLFLFESERWSLFGPSACLDEWMQFAGTFDASQFADDLFVFVEKPSKFIPSVADFILLKKII